jgi:GntR family transcriptional regulator
VEILQRKRGTALHRQVFLVLKERLAAHRYDQGLPTEEALTLEFSVSRATVRSALADLENAGLIRRIHGKGSFPIAQAEPQPAPSSTTYLQQLQQTSAETRISVLDFKFETAPPHVRQNLLIDQQEEQVLYTLRLRSKGRTPVILNNAYVPMRFSVGITKRDLQQTPLYQLLLAQGLAFGRVVQEISACIADPIRAHALKVDVGIALLQMNRTVFSVDDEPVSFTELFFVPDRTKIFQQFPIDKERGFEGGTLVHV